MSHSIPQFAIIADDLTGSLDTGLQFRKKGFVTLVPLHLQPPWPKAEALVLNTDSRNIPGEMAYQKVFQICRRLKAKALYKKIDSTMRGNVGQEVLAILEAQKIPKAIVVPTIPVMGRAVERGILRVYGVPLLKTPYANDPFHPIITSRVAEILHQETGIPAGHISLRNVRKGPVHLAKVIEKSPERILSVDAVLQEDLRSIASAWGILSGRVLACGSVGLADEIRPAPKASKIKPKKDRRPILIISASRNPRTAEQIREAQAHFSFPMIEPEMIRLTNSRHSGKEAASLASLVIKAMTQGCGAILTTTFQEHQPGKEKVIPKALGGVASRILKRIRLGGLVLTGGDLAMGVCQQLSASAISIEEEVLPGIPCSILTDGPFAGLRLVTKAGGFGEKEALWKIIQYLRGEL
ncbi:MAG: hypothetical protein NTY64_01035 [Deltaproteobacteria bacterium]|nr:hypothetical protein [Deltaproteobacteria bacterium]